MTNRYKNRTSEIIIIIKAFKDYIIKCLARYLMVTAASLKN